LSRSRGKALSTRIFLLFVSKDWAEIRQKGETMKMSLEKYDWVITESAFSAGDR
jgi:hypothetical protein